MAAFTNKEKEYIIKMIKEAREELDRLEKQIKEEEKENVGFEEDEIFLLSTEEYEKYKDKIPGIYGWWWLRSPCRYSDCATLVYGGGSVNYNGSIVKYDGGVRPALKLKGEYAVGERIVLYSFPWIVIDKNLAIAEVPIGYVVFNNANENNSYRSSSIRTFLKKWLENRSETLNVNCKEF